MALQSPMSVSRPLISIDTGIQKPPAAPTRFGSLHYRRVSSPPPHASKSPPPSTVETKAPRLHKAPPVGSKRTSLRSSISPTSISPSSMPTPMIHSFHSKSYDTWTYLVVDPVTEEAAIVNPTLDYDSNANAIKTTLADLILQFVAFEGYTITHLLETCIHKDRISSSRYLQLRLGQSQDAPPLICIGRSALQDDGPEQQSPTVFDLLNDKQKFRIGNTVAQVRFQFRAPNQPSGSVKYVVGTYSFGSRIPRGQIQDHDVPTTDDPIQTPNDADVKAKDFGSADPSSSSSSMSPVSHAATTTTTTTTSSSSSSASALLPFYALQINCRAGRIPKKINMAPDQLPGTDRSGDEARQQHRRRSSVAPLPLRIPKKLEMLLC